MQSVSLNSRLVTDNDRQLKKPSLRTGSKTLYLQAPPQLEEATRPNLNKRLDELVDNGEEVSITSSSLPFSLNLKVLYKD